MLTLEKLKQSISYDRETGEMKWISRRSGIAVGQKAGSYDKSTGYMKVKFDGVHYKVHRLVWFYEYGEMPTDCIDHINQIKTDNRIVNLRLATKKQNKENNPIYANNTSGYRGVRWNKQCKKWQVNVGHNKKQLYFGLYDDLMEAVKVAESKRQELYTHYQKQ